MSYYNSNQTQVSLKLLIDKKGKRILYGEADNKFVDFLFTILALPVGTVIKLLSAEPTVGPLANLYRSVGALDYDYFEANQKKDSLLNPKLTVNKSQLGNLLQIGSSSNPQPKSYYCCNTKGCGIYFTATYGTKCSGCSQGMIRSSYYVMGAVEARENEGGYVKGKVTYMVMDDLTLKPMSSISTISLLNSSNVDLGEIEEKFIYLDIKEGVKLLRASLHSTNVLTDVFLHKIDFSNHNGSKVLEEDELGQELWSSLCFYSFAFSFLLFASLSHLFN